MCTTALAATEIGCYATPMRIVGGKFKGRAIKTPEGKTTRPTSDRARESIFNVLAHAEWAPPLEGARVIDAFAGSGALGFEAISRGAAFCLFVETESAARGCIRDTIETFQLFGITRIHRRSAVDLGPKPAGVGTPFNLVFMDPPYAYNLVPPALEQLVRGQWITPDALVVAETGDDEPAPEAPGWTALDSRIYGAARVSFLRQT
jgi:16S rRNA (guanine966-N2)-methyltransferase